MRCPSLKDLPPGPQGKDGWPWTVETPPLPPVRPDGSHWPRISIVTPSYNQGRFIEETIRSILLQGYPNLEYIIIDGGSTDQTVEIIKRYAPWFAYWVSERDQGQAHAINKGLSRATGSLFNWINSDDLLLASALADIGAVFFTQQALAGAVINFGRDEETVIPNRSLSPAAIIRGENGTSFHQPGVWLRPELMRTVGGIDERLHYALDYDLLIRYLHHFPDIEYVERPIAMFRLHGDAKTSSSPDEFGLDRLMANRKYLSDPTYKSLHEWCAKALRTGTLMHHLNQIARSSEPRLIKASRIIAGMLRDPAVWLARPAVGALKRTVFRHHIRWLNNGRHRH
jgi:glycosyltransferase involved in cell wall biosynthesis